MASQTLPNIKKGNKPISTESTGTTKMTLVKPLQATTSELERDEEANMSLTQTKPKIGRLPMILSSGDNDKELSVSTPGSLESDPATLPDTQASSLRGLDIRFTIILLVLFIAVNFGLVALLHTKNIPTQPSTPTVHSAIIKENIPPLSPNILYDTNAPVVSAPNNILPTPSVSPTTKAISVATPPSKPQVKPPVTKDLLAIISKE
jgi:hypothetical protein